MSWSAPLELTDRTVLLAESESLGQIAPLLQSGARVAVITTDPGTSLLDLLDRGLVTRVDPADLETALPGCALVITSDPELAAAARRHGRPVARPVARLADGSTATAAPSARETVVGEPHLVRPAHGDPAYGRVVLVGGGPGDLGLLTLAGLAAVRRADVVVHDRLAPLAALTHAPDHAEIIDVGKIPRGRFTPQETINALLVEHARRGRTVVRLKGGDNYVFGRGGEELQACLQAGVPVEVVPGVSSALAAPALAGIPLTHRTLTQGFTVVSGHLPPGDPGSTLDWSALARSGTTLVILMGVATLGAITAELIRHGLDPATPAATVADGGLPSQRVVRATTADIAEQTRTAGLRPPAVVVIGTVAGFDPLEQV